MGFIDFHIALQTKKFLKLASQFQELHIWGYSSAGRASEWHSEGQRFDPAYLHQNDKPQGQKPCGFVIPRGSDAPYPNQISTLLAPIF